MDIDGKLLYEGPVKNPNSKCKRCNGFNLKYKLWETNLTFNHTQTICLDCGFEEFRIDQVI